jgi:Leishmanolysin
MNSMNDTSTVIYTAVQELKYGTNGTGFMGNLSIGEETLEWNGTSQNETKKNDSMKADFRPIRMRAFLSEIAGGAEHLSPNQRQLLLQNMIRPALLAWSSALRVRPVQGNLTVDATQLHDGGKACGPHNDELPSVSVPRGHLTEGVNDTDVIVYIGLSFTTADEDEVTAGATLSNPFISTRYNTTGKGNTTTDPKSNASKVQTSNGFNGNTNNKTVRSKQKCAGDYMAASTFCSTDQYDRPTAVLMHICIDPTFFFTSNLAANIRAIMHELGHALGFNSVSLAHFRRADGSPITKRNSDGSVPLSSVRCTGPNAANNGTKRQIPLPSDEILKFRTARNGVRVAEIVTPSVVQVVRNHFDCQNLTGAELESGEVLPLNANPGQITCLGDHWERRLFQNDLMNPFVEVEGSHFDPRFSTLTLAYFADSGWYQADLARANYPSTWGRAAGCDFVEQPCVSENGTVAHNYDAYFCTNKPLDSDAIDSEYSSSIQGCTPDLARKASCSLGRHDGDLPPEYQYFKAKYGAEFGGNDPFMDYCPVYSGFANGLCSDSQNEAYIRVSQVERFGSRNSRCLASTIKPLESIATTSDQKESSLNTIDSYTGLCMPIACVVEDRSLRIQVNGIWQTCKQKDEQLVSFVDNEMVTITCPDPVRICPTFYCLRDCLGRSDRRSICDYNAGECVCNGTELQNANNVTICVNRNSQAPQDEGNKTESSTQVDLEDEEDSSPGFFYNANTTNGQLPDPDSPLADYYVVTVKGLDDGNESVFREVWFWIVISFAATIFTISVFLCYCRFVKHNSISDSVDAALNAGADDDQGDNAAAINPNKHKMLANIVVNLRMNDHSLQRRVDAMHDTASVTDLSMTDTEGTVCHLNDVSVEISIGTPELHEVDSASDSVEIDEQVPPVFDVSEFGIDPLAQPSQATQPVVRRRHWPFISNRRGIS